MTHPYKLVGGHWCYLANWCDVWLCGWHLASQMPTRLVLLVLEQALVLRLPTSTGATRLWVTFRPTNLKRTSQSIWFSSLSVFI